MSKFMAIGIGELLLERLHLAFGSYTEYLNACNMIFYFSHSINANNAEFVCYVPA